MPLFDRLPTQGLFAALAYRPFALLWLSQVVSRLGDSLTTIALAWWVLETTGSAGSMAQVLIAATTPQLLLLLAGGVVVDRVDRLRLLVVCDAVRGACVGLIAVLAALDALAFWHLVALSVVFGAAVAFTFPAFVALTPALVPPEALASANSLRTLSVRLASIVGPALAGVIVAAGGTAVAFGLDALSFAVSGTLLLAAARRVAVRPDRGPATGALADLREGFSTVLGSPWLWVTITVAGVSNLTLSGPLGAALPLLVDEELGGSVRAFSLLYALVAVGSVSSAVWLGQRGSDLRRRGVILYAAWGATALSIAGHGLPLPLAAIGAFALLFGVTNAVVNLVWATTLQELVPGERLGRVASIDALGSLGLAPVGYAAAGYAADRWGAAPTFLAGGVLGTLVIAAGLLHPGVRAVGLRRMASESPEPSDVPTVGGRSGSALTMDRRRHQGTGGPAC